MFPIRTFTPDVYGGSSGTFQKFDEKSYDIAFGLRGTLADKFDWDVTASHAEYHAKRERPRLTVAGATNYFIDHLEISAEVRKNISAKYYEAGHMMYIVNEDAPGFIGRIGTLLGENAINIGTFNLGRREAGGEAVLLLSVDEAVPPAVVEAAGKLPGVKRVMALAF